ncbi:alpha/beta fold hydrolase [Thioalkalivibrio sulfidiphilus]|uniref:alpha/beta fold hydrolase n=1 Tax=Thioalkalivibrio sulfidiphilus TaxID=1033854 RepID=UPI000685BD1F|nr:alpha/beta hydrolase [Thioalkalivibrio sulfidiphilus]
MIAYELIGDLAGDPVLYCHGFPTCRLEARLAEAAAQTHGFYFIAADRPGMGRSTHDPERKLTDWVSDAEALLDHLEIERCPVIGVSGGAPYAYLLASRLPDRINALSLVCPISPVNVPGVMRGMSPFVRLGLRLMHAVPSLGLSVFRHLVAPVPRHWPGLLLRMVARFHPPADARLLRNREVRSLIEQSLREGLRQGGVGAALELRLLASFTGEEVDMAPVMRTDIWQGTADPVTPTGMAHWYAHKIPQATLHVAEGAGHFSLPIDLMDDIMSQMLDRTRIATTRD